MNYNLQRNLDLIPQFDTDTLYCLKNFYRDKVNRVSGVEAKECLVSSAYKDDLELIVYYNELCHELYKRGECN